MDKELFAILVFAVLSIGGLLGIGFWADSASCSARWNASGLETQWGVMSGCVVKTPKGWMPEANYRVLP